MESEIAAHSLAKKVGRDQINQSHIDENSGRERVQNALSNQGPGAVGVVGGGDRSADGDPDGRGDGEEGSHEGGGEGVELSLRNAASQGKAFKELMEGEGCN